MEVPRVHARHVPWVLSLIAIAALGYVITLYLPQWLHDVSQRILTRFGRKEMITASESRWPDESPVVTKELGFQKDWWTSPKLYQLERRAIFSKTWLHVCHSSLFKTSGDYRTFNIAGFSFILTLGKDGQLRAFHNVCRHRAYTVCEKSEGSCLVFRCRYHGWTYDTHGKLVKAPKFDEVAGFDKAQNGLFEIRSFIDSSGFVYANFDVYGSDGLTIRVGVPIRAKLTLVDSWSTEADFNWKIAVPVGVFRVSSLQHLNKFAELLSDASAMFESWKWPIEFDLSPLTRLMRSRNGEYWLTITVSPSTEAKSIIQCCFYCSKVDSRDNLPVAAVKQEVKDSIRKLEATFAEVANAGDIPDEASQEPLLAEITAHSRLERLMGRKVHPASRMRETSQACKVADDLCQELEKAAGERSSVDGVESLAW